MNKDEVRGKYLVYKLMYNGEVVYIGQSIQLDLRITSHRKDKAFDIVEYTEVVTKEEMDALEHYLIYHYFPKYNDNIQLSKVREYQDTYLKDFKKLQWKGYIGRDTETIMEAIKSFKVLKYMVEDGKPAPDSIEVNLGWYFENGSAMTTRNDKMTGEPILELHRDYAGNLFKSSLSHIRDFTDEELSQYVYETFIDSNLRHEQVNNMLCIQRLRDILTLHQEISCAPIHRKDYTNE